MNAMASETMTDYSKVDISVGKMLPLTAAILFYLMGAVSLPILFPPPSPAALLVLLVGILPSLWMGLLLRRWIRAWEAREKITGKPAHNQFVSGMFTTPLPTISFMGYMLTTEFGVSVWLSALGTAVVTLLYSVLPLWAWYGMDRSPAEALQEFKTRFYE